MFDTVSIKNAITLFAAAMIIAWIIFALTSFVSIIYNRIFFKTSLKQWLSETKYFLLLYLFAWLIMIYLMCCMLLGIKGILLGIFAIILAATAIVGVRAIRNSVFYFSELTAHKCECGETIVLFTKVTASGNHKPLYYICRGCGKKHDKTNLENDG